MQHASHDQHVRAGQRDAKEISTIKLQATFEMVLPHIGFKRRLYLTQIKTTSADMPVRLRNLDGQTTLRAANIDDSRVASPRKFECQRFRRQQSGACHCPQESVEADRIGIEPRVIAGWSRPSLRLPGTQPRGQRKPPAVQLGVGMVQFSADISVLTAIEVEIAISAVGVKTVLVALEKADRHKRIEEIPGAAWIDGYSVPQLFESERSFSEYGKQSQLNRTQDDLCLSECKGKILDPVGSERRSVHSHYPVGCCDRITGLAAGLLFGRCGRSWHAAPQ